MTDRIVSTVTLTCGVSSAVSMLFALERALGWFGAIRVVVGVAVLSAVICWSASGGGRRDAD